MAGFTDSGVDHMVASCWRAAAVSWVHIADRKKPIREYKNVEYDALEESI
jgi:hypothetical protein